MNARTPFIVVLAALSLGACATQQPETILSQKGAVELRAMQSRASLSAETVPAAGSTLVIV